MLFGKVGIVFGEADNCGGKKQGGSGFLGWFCRL